MHSERRVSPRAPVQLLFNKYVDGVPYLWELLEVSMSGALIRCVGGPDAPRASYAIEVAPQDRDGASDKCVWLCATPVWRSGRYEALEFVGQSTMDRLKLANLIAETRAAA